MDKDIQEKLYRLLGEDIRHQRSKLELTQEQLAAEVGLTRTSVAKIEKGKQHTSLHVLIDIADALNMDLGMLIPKETEYKPIVQIDEKTLKDVKDADKSKFEQFYKGFLNDK